MVHFVTVLSAEQVHVRGLCVALRSVFSERCDASDRVPCRGD